LPTGALTGLVALNGVANDPNFSKWQLDLLPGGDENAAIFLALGSNPGQFTYSLDTTAFPAGEHALRLRVVRADSNYNEYTVPLILGAAAAAAATPAPTTTAAPTTAAAPTAGAPATAAPAMANGITAPAEGATVSGTTDVTGYANDPAFSKWQLDVLPEGDASKAIFVTSDRTPGEFIYSLDTTAFPPGQHALRLRVVRADSNYNEYTTNFTIAQ
jgi:hypothetical protein